MFVGTGKCEGIYCQHASACKPLAATRKKKLTVKNERPRKNKNI